MVFRRPTVKASNSDCAGCGQPVGARWLTALDQCWHPEHFTCCICGERVTGDFVVDDGRPAHENCWAERRAPRCQACAQPILGDHRIDLWNQPSCASCLAAGDCDHCGGAGKRPLYSDTCRCETCRRLAVNDPIEAERLYQQVVTWAEGKRFFENFKQPPMALYSSARLQREFSSADKSTLGMAQRLIRETPSGTSTQAQQVVIVRGLPAPLFQAVAAHEIGHVWVATNGILHISKQEEEGFCELLSHLWIAECCGIGREGLLRNIEESTDPIYGDGFRAMKALEQRSGLFSVMQLLVSRSRIAQHRQPR
jgi:hypothetical protein